MAVCALTLLVAGCSREAGRGDLGTGATYVALGDSYTSAPGVPEIVDAACFRSSVNYPALVAKELDIALTDVSCGGAATTALVGVQETTAGPVPPQFAALTKETDVVTLGIGGNDEGLFGVLLTTCLTLKDTNPDGAPCRDQMNAGGTDQVLGTIEVIQTRLTSALVGIKDRAPDATVIMVGYPQLVPAEGTCDILPLTPDDAQYFRGIMVALGDATAAAAEEAGAEYVDLLAASEGHDVCAGADAWVNGLGSPTDQAAAMHPFAREQAAVAKLVVEVIEGH